MSGKNKRMHVLPHTIMAYEHCHTTNSPCDIRDFQGKPKTHNLIRFEMHRTFQLIHSPIVLTKLYFSIISVSLKFGEFSKHFHFLPSLTLLASLCVCTWTRMDFDFALRLSYNRITRQKMCVTHFVPIRQ